MKIHFLFLGEGSSDDGLVPHLEKLCVQAGADEVTGVCPDLERLRPPVGRSVKRKMQAALRLEPSANLIFVHRDADSNDPKPRFEEILAASQALERVGCVVCVVPVREIEAWLLPNERAIRLIAGRQDPKINLNLPKPSQVESITNPKADLRAALAKASGLNGRRLQKFKQDFAIHRRLLMQELSDCDYLEDISAWKRLRQELQTFIDNFPPPVDAQ